jgi:ribosome modulation factor
MHLDRSPAPYLAQGLCARKQFPPSVNISHTFSCRRVVVCLDRSGEPGICQGRLKSICPYQSQNQNRYRYVSSLRQIRFLNVIYDQSTKRLF